MMNTTKMQTIIPSASSEEQNGSFNVPELIDQNFICALFNIKPDNVKQIHCVRDTKNNETSIFLKLNPSNESCPFCGASQLRTKDYYTRKIKHSVLRDSKSILFYKDRRYECRSCHKTFYAQNPFTENGFNHSLLTTQMVLNDLKDPNRTMASIAKQHHISATTVANIFDAHVEINRRKLSKFISVDEVYAFKSNKSKYVCVLLDYKNKVPIEILPSRRYEELARFFSSIPLEERRQVAVFSCDMWDAYRSIAKRYLPNSITIVDHFHVIQECNRRLDHIRLEIQKKFDRNTTEYYLLKKFNWLLFKNDDQLLDSNRKRRHNRRIKRDLNYHDIKCLLQDTHPQLEMAINLKDALCMFYDSIKILEVGEDPTFKEEVPALKKKADGTATYRSTKLHNETVKRNNKRVLSDVEALKELEELIHRFRECPLHEFSSFAATLNEWKHEIVNSLRVYTELNRRTVSNALIENRNKIIKNVKRTSNGYNNWHRFRARLMYTLDPDSTYSLFADESVIENKRQKNREHYQAWKQRKNKPHCDAHL